MTLVSEAERLQQSGLLYSETEAFGTLASTFKSGLEDFLCRAEACGRELQIMVNVCDFCEQVGVRYFIISIQSSSIQDHYAACALRNIYSVPLWTQTHKYIHPGFFLYNLLLLFLLSAIILLQYMYVTIRMTIHPKC